VYVTQVQNYDGNWTVANNQVVFTPSVNFLGGFTGISYQLTDGLGHTDNNGYVSLNFP
jgi:hypothetical protein